MESKTLQQEEPENEFLCRDGETYVINDQVCDGIPHCPQSETSPGGEDEEHCERSAQEPAEITTTTTTTTTTIIPTTTTSLEEEGPEIRIKVDYYQTLEMLLVTVLDLKDLPNTDRTWLGLVQGSPDVRIHLSISNGAKCWGFRTTPTIWHDNNPSVSQTLNFQVDEFSPEESVMELTALDHDITCHRVIGQVISNIDQVMGKGIIRKKLDMNLLGNCFDISKC